MPGDNQREYKVGQRVYCPTYGGYGQITKMGTDKATITMIGMWGIGSVQIKHGDYEQPKYQPDHDYNEPLHESYQKYSEGVWNTGEMALTYHDWLQEQVAQIAQLTAERDALRMERDLARNTLEFRDATLRDLCEKLDLEGIDCDACHDFNDADQALLSTLESKDR